MQKHSTQVAIGKLDKLNVFGSDYNTPDGTCIRDYVHIDDLATGHLKALEKIKIGFEVINLGSGKGYSVFEIIENFEIVMSKKILFGIIERRPGDIAISFADILKATELLDWSPTKEIGEMCLIRGIGRKKHPNGFKNEYQSE